MKIRSCFPIHLEFCCRDVIKPKQRDCSDKFEAVFFVPSTQREILVMVLQMERISINAGGLQPGFTFNGSIGDEDQRCV